MRSNDACETGDAVSAELTALLGRLGELARAEDAAVSDAARVDRIALFEQIRTTTPTGHTYTSRAGPRPIDAVLICGASGV
ncbi:hypothetical protein LQ327_28335 [Actinomycetospora endophytica]|uniref:Uncharacterized protein n=1 Tax=Actinomycetospora endophytica TaxID=2291215 RepID=A0ABS8PH77_9PSEU|nr:hypothetical protein [Actinomycetospora endophytica]MCD2197287.1 hypothetical protein [Actinomycetospora endophytica]